MPHPQIDAVAARVEASFDQAVSVLPDYLRHPAISCDPEHHDDVRALAARIAEDLGAAGFQGARVCDLPDALPIVVAEWLGAGADKPTVLIYGHLDLQPVVLENWRTDPHEPTVVGERLYARGAADDMGGWVSHLVSLQAWLEETGSLPCNVKLVIEGEEEIGSPNLERFMDAYPEAFVADAMVLTDCENPSTEVPGLTVSLRGLMEVELIVEALDADGHSGLWGGMIPDVSLALVKLIDRFVDDNGRLKILPADVPEAWRARARDVPLTEEVFRKGAHLLEDVAPLPPDGRPPAEWMWRQPALTVVATTLPRKEDKKNALRTRASAVLSIRLGPGQRIEQMRAAVEATVQDPPMGVRVSLDFKGWAGEGWLYEPEGPAFPAADRAYEKAWGEKMAWVGVGGSIPFVAIFGRRFGDLPLILNGVMDPETTAHGPNESLHLGVFRKAMLANVYLYDELAAALAR